MPPSLPVCFFISMVDAIPGALYSSTSGCDPEVLESFVVILCGVSETSRRVYRTMDQVSTRTNGRRMAQSGVEQRLLSLKGETSGRNVVRGYREV